MSRAGWEDLRPRVISGLGLVAAGLVAIWAGGLVFGAAVALAVGLIGWEILRMSAPDQPALARGGGVLMGLAVLAAGFVGPIYALVLLALVVLSLPARASRGAGQAGPVSHPVSQPVSRARLSAYLAWVLLAGYGLSAIRADQGAGAVLWLVSIVVATDIAGYFAGRLIGGPKFWPAISPKKTWAGTIAGWIAAGLIGLATGGGAGGLLAVALSFASQMGDAAESALKRRTGIKDSSSLIPGHGGVFDRFDALLGAALVATIVGIVT